MRSLQVPLQQLLPLQKGTRHVPSGHLGTLVRRSRALPRRLLLPLICCYGDPDPGHSCLGHWNWAALLPSGRPRTPPTVLESPGGAASSSWLPEHPPLHIDVGHGCFASCSLPPMFIHQLGCRGDEKAASRLLPGASACSGSRFAGKPPCSPRLALPAAPWLLCSCQGNHHARGCQKSLNPSCFGRIQSQGEFLPLLKNPKATLGWLCPVPGFSDGLCGSHLSSCRAVPGTQGAGQCGLLLLRVEQSKSLLQGAWLAAWCCNRDWQLLEQKQTHV